MKLLPSVAGRCVLLAALASFAPRCYTAHEENCSLGEDKSWLLHQLVGTSLFQHEERKLAEARRPTPLISEGWACQGDAINRCADSLLCRCFVPNRGLKLCLQERWPLLSAKAQEAAHLERQGLNCKPKHLATAMAAPPLVPSTGGELVDLRDSSTNVSLRTWAQHEARGFYSRYVAVSAGSPRDDGQHSIALLAGDDVHEELVKSKAAALRHILQALNPPIVAALAQAGVRVLIAGTRWLGHPEVNRHFTSGLGGGAPWFPSTGIEAEEPANALAEEVFHTVQYVAMTPREVCMYHNAYAVAVDHGLYTTDGSGPEIDGEPVPTVQADEYFAMALQRWLGSHDAPGEYLVPGNDKHGTGREHLRSKDPYGFCLVSMFFNSSDAWNPEPKHAPWRNFPNRGMDQKEVHSFCQVILEGLGDNCPPFDLGWPSKDAS